MSAREDEQRGQIMKQLPGWRIWYVYNWKAADHTWCAMPLGAIVSECVAESGGPGALAEMCKTYETGLDNHILAAQARLEREQATADPLQLKGLTVRRDALMALKVAITAAANGIELPV